MIIVNDLMYSLNSKSIIVSYAIKPTTGKCLNNFKAAVARTVSVQLAVEKNKYLARKSRNIQSFFALRY